jgi:hypothetical protein
MSLTCYPLVSLPIHSRYSNLNAGFTVSYTYIYILLSLATFTRSNTDLLIDPRPYPLMHHLTYLFGVIKILWIVVSSPKCIRNVVFQHLE